MANYGYICGENGSLSLYLYINGCIVRRDITDGVRGRAECIAENTGSYFSVTLCGGESVVVYRQGSDTVMLSHGESRVIQRTGSEGEIYLSVLIDEGCMRLVCINGATLVTHTSGSGGGAVELDEVYGTVPYKLIPVVKGGYALLYVRRIPELQLGYRELTAGAVGNFKEVYTTGFDIGEYTVCAANGCIYIAFVAASRFAVRVMLAKRTKSGFTRAKTVWEGSRCQCLCAAADGSDVFIWWESGANIFEAVSHNSADSFALSRKKGANEPVFKAQVLSGGYGISEVMVSENGVVYAPEQVRELVFSSFDRKQRGKKMSVQENVKKDKDIIAELKEELEKKQQEIESLSYTLRNKNNESIRLENALRQRCRELEGELERIKSEGTDNNGI